MSFFRSFPCFLHAPQQQPRHHRSRVRTAAPLRAAAERGDLAPASESAPGLERRGLQNCECYMRIDSGMDVDADIDIDIVIGMDVDVDVECRCRV